MNNQILTKSTITTFYVIISQLLGLLLTMFVAKKFGANNNIDIIYYIINISSFIIALFTGIFKTTLIPFIFNEVKKNQNNLSIIQNAFLTYFTIILLLLSVLMIIFSETNFFFISFPFLEEATFTKKIFYFSIPFIFFSVLQSLISTYSNINYKFGLAEIVNISKIIIALFVVFYLSNSLFESSIIIGNFVGAFASFFITIIYLKRNKLLNFYVDFRYLILFKRMLSLSIIPLLTSLMISSQIIVTNYLLGVYGTTGSITLLAFSQRFSSIPTLLFSSGFLTVFLTYSSKLEAENKSKELKNTITKSISFLSFLVIPTILYFVLIKEYFIKLLLIYTDFDKSQCNLISHGLIILLISALFLQFYSIVFRIYIIKKEYNILFLFSIIYFVFHLIFSFFIIQYTSESLIGASIGIFASNFILLIISFFYIYKKHDVIDLNYVLKNFIKNITGIFIVSLIFFQIKDSELTSVLHISSRIILYFIGSFSIYFTTQYIIRNNDFISLFNKIKSSISDKKK